MNLFFRNMLIYYHKIIKNYHKLNTLFKVKSLHVIAIDDK